MNSVVAVRRDYPRPVLPDPVLAREQAIKRRLNIAWGLLYLNTMTYVAGFSAIGLPSKVGKGLAQGSLPLAIILLLTINPKLRIRPNLFLCLYCLLILDSVLTAVQVHHLGTEFRTFRFAEYMFALWLTTPWWGRADMLILRCHLRWLYVALGSVGVGMLISPGKAFAYGGRLTGDIWPMLPTQIAQYAAVAIGLTAVLWMGRLVGGRAALVGVSYSVILLLLTHTRTALLALGAGIILAGLSLFAGNARVRRFFLTVAGVTGLAVVTAAGIISTWLARGENAQGITSLTGRTNFWALVLNLQRTRFQEIFGFGLSNAGINGNPIDSNWLSAYMQEGLFGVVVLAGVLVFLLAATLFQPPGIRRALSLLLVTYVLVSSFTEDAISDVSTYLLHLVVAASLFVVVGGPAGVTGARRPGPRVSPG
jgi:hypothetical protein